MSSELSMPELDWHARHADHALHLRQEEWANCLTHALGALAATVGVCWLVPRAWQSGDRQQVIACVVYGLSLVAVLAASAASHAWHHTSWRRLLRTIDQACIFLLIAASFSPLAVTYLRQGPWWLVHLAVWSVALYGFTQKALFAHRIESVTPRLHLLLGWLPVMTLPSLLQAAPSGLLWGMALGGICYTLGTLFLVSHRRYFHTLWHVWVLAGCACHFFAIATYCTTRLAA